MTTLPRTQSGRQAGRGSLRRSTTRCSRVPPEQPTAPCGPSALFVRDEYGGADAWAISPGGGCMPAPNTRGRPARPRRQRGRNACRAA